MIKPGNIRDAKMIKAVAALGILGEIAALIAPHLEEPIIDYDEEASYETGCKDGRQEGKHELATLISHLLKKE